MTHRGLGLLLAAILLGLPSCGGGGSGDDGPMGPATPPVVSSVTPAEALAGEPVTIAGSGFGSTASAVTVSFRGEPATVGAVSDASITATVPEIAPGDATVVVTVSGRASDPVGFRVLQSPPVVTALEPNPVRAGETLVIRGRNFTTEPNGLRTAQDDIQVMIDARLLTVDEVFFDRIGLTLPFDLEPGSSELTVRVGDLSSEMIPIDIHAFSLHGVWWPSMSSSVTANDCGFGAAIGVRFPYGFTITDDGSGSLGGFYNGIELSGTYDLDQALGEMSGSLNGMTLEVDIDGTGQSSSLGERSLDMLFRFLPSGGCRIEASVDATVASEQPFRYVGGVTLFDDLHDPSQSFTQVTGHFDVPILDLVNGQQVGMLPMSVDGESFAFRQGNRTLLDFVSGSLRWRVDLPSLSGIDTAVPGPFCVWAPQSTQTIFGALLDGAGSELFSEEFPPGEDLRLQLPFRSGASVARYTESGDGFSRIEFAYSGFFDTTPPSSFDTNLARMCDLSGGGYGGY